MKKIFLLSFFSLFLFSCGTTKTSHRSHKSKTSSSSHHNRKAKTTNSHKNKKRVADSSTKDFLDDRNEESSYKIKQEIIDYAKTFEGTRYKFGGTTESGMDCSGLVSTAFKKENIDLPRISRDMATQGVSISLNDIEKGDLVFFKTSRKNVISHVGLVVEANRGEVKFIHSTTRAGVIISSLDETYWKKAFVEVRRVI